MPKNIIVGMNVHNRYYAPYTKTLEQNLDDCAQAGIKIIRFNHSGTSEEDFDEIRRTAEGCHKRNMKILLCMDHYDSWIKWDKSLPELEIYFESLMEKVASKFKDLIDVYQVFNETDVCCMNGDIYNITIPGKDGRELGEYDCAMHEKCIYAMRGSLRGLKKGYPDAVTSINFCWWHTAHLYDLYDKGCRWDIIGLDWYSDAEEVSSIDLILKEVAANIPESDFMICETNQWNNFHAMWDEEKRNLISNRESRNALQAEWVPSFIQKLYEMDMPRFKGVIFYELLDEPDFELSNGSYVGDSHYGFIECDSEGGKRTFKPAWKTMCDKIKELGL